MRLTSFRGLSWWTTFVTAAAVLVPCVTVQGAQLLGLYTFEENSVAEVRDVGPMGNHPVDLSDPDCRTNFYDQACYPTSGGTIVADGFQGKGLSVSGEGSMGVTAENPVPTPAMRQEWADTGQTLYLPIDLNPPPGGPPEDARVATIGGWFKTRHLGFGQHSNPPDSPQRAGLWSVDNGGWDRGVMRDSNRYYVTGGEYVNTQAVNPDIVAIQDQWQFVAATFPTSTHWKIWVDGFQECYHCATVHPCLNSDFSLRRYKIENKDRFSFHSCMRKGQKTPKKISPNNVVCPTYTQ